MFRKYIALLLALIFLSAMFPFNMFHHHEEDEHRLAMVTHRKDHSCELDKNFCKDETLKTCGHEHHINKPLPKCFSCQFHVEKIFENVPLFSFHINRLESGASFFYFDHAATIAARLISNKGPPSSC